MKKAGVLTTALFLIFTSLMFSTKSMAQDDLPAYLKDRGTGQPTSMFGTYIRKGELLVYPFYEYYLDNNLEYNPAEFGYGLTDDFEGKYRASEGIFFISYGITDWLAIEFEAATIKASLEKSPDDRSNMPAKIEESGTGDIEGQIRARWQRENERRPEIFSYFEAVSPQQKDKLLIGTPDWELKFGSGLIKGFSWGTLTARAGVEYLLEDSSWDLGEFAIEYLKRLSPSWRVYLGVEGKQDDMALITEAQWHLADFAYLKFNNGFGITAKATDWAPEIGVIFSLK